ncbi:hypothetical protein [Pseudomonas guariconensis]|uniref:glycine-rich domain-containing protein n=1 Tax=Pseudomonas guariconensis TaxID=1288410 RepID=UPI001113AC87|nr:hypothetical protein [Pseudomonas guariconensis]
MALLDTVLLRSWRIGVDPIVASTTLTAEQLGHVVVDAAAGAVAVTLPSASAALGGVEVTLRRKDVTANVLSIVTAGADKIVLPGTADGIAATELLFPGDYLTLRSDGAGKWWCVAQAQLPASVTSVVTKYAVAGVYTYTVPPVFRSGRRRARVTVTGGGGGGGHNEGALNTTRAEGGGGGGGRGTSILDLYGVSTVTVTVGAGGAGGAAGAVNVGVSGGASSFGIYISSTGGVGGTQPSGGMSGTTTGDIVHLVAAAGAGTDGSLGHGGGYGAPSYAASFLAGLPGVGPGGGGAGGIGTSGTRGGGAGKPGEVIVEVA